MKDATKNVIEGFEKMTKQELFDMSVKHVLANGKASLGPDGNCSYAGVGCAASPFLSLQARQELKGNWAYLYNNGIVPEHEGYFIQMLQSCHDTARFFHVNSDFISRYKEHADRVATFFKLKLPEGF